MSLIQSGVPRCAVNAHFLHHPHTGSGRYLREILARPGDFDYALYESRAFPPTVVIDQPVRLLRSPFDRRSPKLAKIWLEQIACPRAARTADLLHYPYFAAPLVSGPPVVVTVHDLAPLLRPEYRRSPQARLYVTLVRAGTRRAQLILTDSEFSRREIISHLGVPADRVRAIPLAVDPRFHPLQDDRARQDSRERLRSRFNLVGPFILNVGGLERRKNIPTLIEAFSRVRSRLAERLSLVITGRVRTGDDVFDDPRPLITAAGLDRQVHLIGTPDDDDLLALYNQAAAFVFPSRYEGFGIPPLEAMAAGAPVICSNRTSLPEVVGDAALLFDPDDPEQLVTHLLTILKDESCAEDLRQRGLAQAARFSWDETARRTHLAYRDALTSRRAQPCALR